MKKLYQFTTKWGCFCLLWVGMAVPQFAGAQTLTDVQWSATANEGLAIRKSDGAIVTTSLGFYMDARNGSSIGFSLPRVYSLAGTQIASVGFGGQTVGGPERPFFVPFSISPNLLGATAGGATAYIGSGFIVKVDASGTRETDRKPFSSSDFVQQISTQGRSANLEKLIGTFDGGFLLLVTSIDPAGKTTVFVRKYDPQLNTVWTKSLAYPTPNPATPDRSLTRAKTVIQTPDGGYLLAGFYNTTGQLDNPQVGWVAKLNDQGDVVWQKLLNSLPLTTNANGAVPNSIAAMQSVNDAIPNTDASGVEGYALVGVGLAPGSPGGQVATTSILELKADGSFKNARSISTESVPQSFIARYVADGGAFFAVGTTSAGNPQIILVRPTDLTVANQRVYNNTPPYGALTAFAIAGDGAPVFTTSNRFLVKLTTRSSSFALLQPTYNCSTGAITFNVSGSDGSPITYTAPGISRSSATSNSGTVEAGLRADPKTIPITGTQSGQTSTVIFDLAAFCSSTPPPPGFNLLAPTYNCQTGAITFNTSGGNGSPITFSAPGIARSSLISNVGTVEAGLRADPKTIPITAMQSGQTSTFVFDLPGLCGRQARIASPEDRAGLQVVLLGNPIATAVSIVVSGAEGQALWLELVDTRGRVLGQRAIERAGELETHTFELGQQAGGLFLVRALSGQQSQTVKVVKQ